MKTGIFLSAALLLGAVPATAQDAPLPEAAQAMLDAAIATGKADTVKAVVESARTAFPNSAARIDAIQADFLAEQRAQAAEQAAREERALRQAGLFDNWSGEGQVGGFHSSGNNDEIGVTTALRLEREGIDWEHRLRFSADYRRGDGITTREQYLAMYEPRYQISQRLFAFGLARFDSDNRQGFDARYSASGGFGYKLVDTDDMELSIKAGPAYRITEFNDGTTRSRLAGLFGLDYDWQITDSIKFTQDANSTVETGGEVLVIVDGSNTSLSAISGLEAGIADNLTARVSYAMEYESNPPGSAENLDTLTRFSLIYGF